MELLKWLRRRGTKQARKLHPTKRPARFHPRLEALEDRSLPSAGPSFGWAAAIGDPSPPNTSISYAVATDSTGNVYTTGFFTGEFLPTGATTPLYSNTGGHEIFVTKYSPAGVLQWDIGIGGTANQAGLGIAVDNAGHVDIAGAFHGTATFGSTMLTATGSSYNPFVAQLDANSGNVLWATNPFPTNDYLATSVAVDSGGNVYVAGQDYYSNSFAAKVGSNGTLLWQDQIATPQNGSPADDGVAVSGSNVYFSGGFNVSATFSTASGNHKVSNNANGGIAAYVLNLTSNNQFVWAHVFQPVAQRHQSPGIVEINSIAADSNGDVYATGPIYGMVNFAGSTSTTGPFVLNGGSEASYVVKLSSTGSALWAEQFGPGYPATSTSASLTVDGAGNVYLAGSYSGTTSFFGTNLTSYAGVDDAFVLKLTSNGTFQWVVSAGGPGGAYGEGIAVDNSGNLYVTGGTANVGFLWQLTQG